MNRYICILRGINVSGKNPLPMAALRELFASLGCQRVATYIQSGNAVFDAEGTATELEERISGAIHDRFGFEVPVLLLTAGYLAEIVAGNPYLINRSEDPAKLHVTFFSRQPGTEEIAALEGTHYPPDEWFAGNRAVYLFCPEGYGNTKFSNAFFERKLKVTATTRNWKTVNELLRMASLA